MFKNICLVLIGSLVILANCDSPVIAEESHQISQILDSHTFQLQDGRIIRLIGVKDFGCRLDKNYETLCTTNQSKEYVENIFIHYANNLILEFDKHEQDSEGRSLVYAYIPTGFLRNDVTNIPAPGDYHFVYRGDQQVIFLNAAIIKNGYARHVNHPINNKHRADLLPLYIEAKRFQRGLWPQFVKTELGDPCLGPGECNDVDCSVIGQTDAETSKPICGQNICRCVNFQMKTQ